MVNGYRMRMPNSVQCGRIRRISGCWGIVCSVSTLVTHVDYNTRRNSLGLCMMSRMESSKRYRSTDVEIRSNYVNSETEGFLVRVKY